jgi:hypothetical protein
MSQVKCLLYHVQVGRAKHNVMNDFVFLWEAAIFGHLQMSIYWPTFVKLLTVDYVHKSLNLPIFIWIRPLGVAEHIREVYRYRENYLFPWARSQVTPTSVHYASYDAVPYKEGPFQGLSRAFFGVLTPLKTLEISRYFDETLFSHRYTPTCKLEDGQS